MLKESTIKEYIINKNYLIYKKRLRNKNGKEFTYYLVIKDNEIVDVIHERFVKELIKEDRLSNKNIDLIVYKTIVSKNNRYYSFRHKDYIEYKLNELIESNNSLGIFFCKDKKGTEEHFYEYENRVILKAKVKINDLIGGYERSLQFSKCIPFGII